MEKLKVLETEGLDKCFSTTHVEEKKKRRLIQVKLRHDLLPLRGD